HRSLRLILVELLSRQAEQRLRSGRVRLEIGEIDGLGGPVILSFAMLPRQYAAQGVKLQRVGFFPDTILEDGDKVVFRAPFAPVVAPAKNFLLRIGAPYGVCGLEIALTVVLVREETTQNLHQEWVRLPLDPVFNLANDLRAASFAPQPVSPALKIIKM